MSASWDFLLCSGTGEPLAELTTAAGKQILYKRNHYAEVQFSISHKDDAAYPLLEAVETGPWPTLRCYRKSEGEPPSSPSVLRFNGYLAPFSESLDENRGLLTAVFRSPFGRLLGDGWSGSGRYTGVGVTAEEKYADEIAASLIKLYGGAGSPIGGSDPVFNEQTYQETYFTGLGIGSIASTIKRSITYKFANVGQAIINLSQALDGFDFYETFVDGGGTMLANFNTTAALGEERPNARFEFGDSTLGTVRHVERTTAPPNNVIRLIGGGGIFAESQAATESLTKYGKWVYQQQAAQTSDIEKLEARAEALRRAFPVRTYSIQPDIGLPGCPKPFDDFNVGDTIPFFARHGAFVTPSEAPLMVRLNELQIVIDENGNETAAIPNPHSLSAEDRHNRTDLLHTSFTVETGNAN